MRPYGVEWCIALWTSDLRIIVHKDRLNIVRGPQNP